MAKSKSAYSVPGKIGKIERHIIVVWVDNEAGVLARIAGLFSGRGYNIESLAVAEVDKKKHISRITIVTEGTPQVIEQINLQLKKLVQGSNVTYKSLPLKFKFLFKALNSACGLPLVDVEAELITELFLTTKHPTDGLVEVLPKFFSAKLKARLEKKLRFIFIYTAYKFFKIFCFFKIFVNRGKTYISNFI